MSLKPLSLPSSSPLSSWSCALVPLFTQFTLDQELEVNRSFPGFAGARLSDDDDEEGQ